MPNKYESYFHQYAMEVFFGTFCRSTYSSSTMYVLIVLLYITGIRAQGSLCSCLCCSTLGCTPTQVGTINMPSCTISSCADRCRNTFLDCGPLNAQVQVSPQCSSTVAPLYNCQCNCCRTGSTTCAPSVVGYSSAYTCQDSSCSISCATRYPTVCVADQTGQTQGSCAGLISTTTTLTTSIISTTTINPVDVWLAHTCSCRCCQAGTNCAPNIEVGIASAAECSSTACTQACQNRYSAACPSLTYLGRANGTCTSQGNGGARCRCRCCDQGVCKDYEPNFNGNCASCKTRCQQVAPCANRSSVTEACSSNQSKLSCEFNALYIFFLLIISLELVR